MQTWERLAAFTEAVSCLAAGVLPVPEVRTATQARWWGRCVLAGLVATLLGGLASLSTPGAVGPLMVLAGLVGLDPTRNVSPKAVYFEERSPR